jgi:hypothetical protein
MSQIPCASSLIRGLDCCFDLHELVFVCLEEGVESMGMKEEEDDYWGRLWLRKQSCPPFFK